MLENTKNWDLEEQRRGRGHQYDANARQMLEADATNEKQEMLAFKARCSGEEVRWQGQHLEPATGSPGSARLYFEDCILLSCHFPLNHMSFPIKTNIVIL